ncbi:hypothetical protein [Brevibacillus sp. SYSU BS000544]|uniref:hypothetical protein n=1 Tax=Brevibacillus sp. SYSU BS000544 TaxID=3416443 RepID=UPI003CE540DC
MIIYTEDEFTKLWVESMLRYYGADLQSIEVHYIGGDGNAVQINKFNNQNPGRKAPSICLIDGDSSQSESEIEKVFRLPGYFPEEHVYDSIYDAFSEVSAMLCIALGWDTSKQTELKRQMESVKTTNRGYHLLFNQLGMKLSLIWEETVRTAFLNVWCHHFREELHKTLYPVNDLLPITETV